MTSVNDITRFLSSAREGDREAVGVVFERVYEEIRRIAHREARRMGNPDTMNTTAIVNEAYLKLVNAPAIAWQDRGHFFAVAATAMRQILVDYARRGSTARRGGGERAIPLHEMESSLAAGAAPAGDTVLALDAALTRLGTLDARLARVVDLRFFAGLSVEETAKVLGVTDRTVKRDWRRARAFLQNELASVEPA